jgi:hypothetical protein
MKPKIFSNAILGSGIPVTFAFNLHATNSTSDRVYRMTQPGSWWLMITPASNWIHEVLAIEVRVTGPSTDRLIQQYRYIQRRTFQPRRNAWVYNAFADSGNDRYAVAQDRPGTFNIFEAIRTPAPIDPYRQANSFGPFYIHSYLVPDTTNRLFHTVGGASYDLPAIEPAATPTYRSPDATRIGEEPRQMLHAWFTVGEGERCDVRVRGFNHDVSRLPGFTDTIPEDCEPAADEVGAAWTDATPPFGERPGFFLLPVTL